MVDSIVLPCIADNAMMSYTLFYLIFRHKGYKFTDVGMLFVIDLSQVCLCGFCSSIADVIGVVLVTSTADIWAQSSASWISKLHPMANGMGNIVR